MWLSELARATGSELGGPDVEVTGIAVDSRRLRPGDLFVALDGSRRTGAAFVREALSRGAAAVCVGTTRANPELVPPGAPVLRVRDPRRALARMSAVFFGEPARSLTLIGVTGTLGETSTALLIQAALAATRNGPGALTTPVGIVGSLGARVRGVGSGRHGGEPLPDTDGMTTPDAPTLHRAFRAMLEMGVRTVAMEVTSHALAQRRVDGLQYALGVVTNLVPDEHLEFHRTPEEYLRTKVRFFDYLAPGAPLVINADDLLVREKVAEATRRAPRPVIAVSLGSGENPAVRVEGVSWDGGGSAFALHVTRPIPRLAPAAAIEPGVIRIAVPVLGLQHVANAAIAATAALVAGASPGGITEGLAELEPITRRMEIVRAARPRIVDDTAGNPVTLRTVFATIDGLEQSALRVVFGIRGSRGPEINRRLATTLGGLVCARARRYPVTLVVTASEDTADRRNRVQPEERDAALGALDAVGAPHTFEPTLAAAVARALDATGDDDLLLLLGAQGMDRAAELTRRALEIRVGTR